jgi:hypothetical protein
MGCPLLLWAAFFCASAKPSALFPPQSDPQSSLRMSRKTALPFILRGVQTKEFTMIIFIFLISLLFATISIAPMFITDVDGLVRLPE